MPFKHWKHYSPTSRKARVLVVQASVTAFLQDLPSKNFFPTSRLTQESEGFYTTSYVQGQRSRVLNQEIPFWFTSIGVQKQPVLVDVLAPTRLALQGSHVQRQYQKRTTLCSKKQYHKRTTLRTLKILLQRIL
jgi:hypothetical protein